jgi:hypothetical protein
MCFIAAFKGTAVGINRKAVSAPILKQYSRGDSVVQDNSVVRDDSVV